MLRLGSALVWHLLNYKLPQVKAVRHAFEPLLEEQGLAAPRDHSSTMEVHKSWYGSIFQFSWLVEVKLDVESANTRVSDCFHFL